MRSSLATFVLLGLALAANGCSDTDGGAPDAADASADETPPDDAGTDANNGAPSDAYPAPHPAFPIVASPGNVIAAPKIMPIFFTGDPSLAKVTSFAQGLGASSYWSGAVGEYGIAPIAARDPVVVDPSELTGDGGTSLTSANVEAFIASHLDGNHAGWGTPDATTIYTLFLPASVTVDDPALGVSCQDFGGDHDSVPIGGVDVAFAVIPRCSSFNGVQGADDVTTYSASHELVEAATDPFATQHLYGYTEVDLDHFFYQLLPGSELADMCTFEGDSHYKPADFDFMVQPIWSNANAALGKPPCQPRPAGTVYYAAVPVMPSAVSFVYGSSSTPTRGVVVPLGKSATFDVDLISDGPTNGPFEVEVVDATEYLGGSPDVTYELDRSSGVNGEILHATATRLKKGPYGGSELVVIAATNLANVATNHLFYGFAAN
ncbi:MAG TPA: hypothetical protein VGH28_01120 [Polyangiaceae bacterium]